MRQLIQLFGVSTELLEKNHCLIYKTTYSGNFEYHNFTNLEEARVIVFSRVIDDVLEKRIDSPECELCKTTDLVAVQPKKRTKIVYDKEEVDRVNFTLRQR